MRSVLAAFLIGLGMAGAAAAQEGALRVPVRASEDATALVVEEVILYRGSHALVVGIDSYTNGWPRLSMAVNDARIIAEELKRHGFDVTLKTNLNAVELEQTLREFFVVKGQNPEARLFFWFAGHGHTEQGEGFIVPADAPRADLTARFMLSALPMRRFGEYVRLARSKHVFAVFDSCFSGTIFDAQRSLPSRAITNATRLPVRQFLTSGDAEQTVFDNGTFRDLFLRALRGEDGADANRDGFVTASEVGLYLTDRITNLTQTRQTPRYGKLLDKDLDRGDFVFKVLTTAALRETPTARAPAGADAAAFELAFWDTIKNSTDPGDFKAYLEAFPNGRFAPLARRRAELAAPVAAAPAPPAATAAPPQIAALPPPRAAEPTLTTPKLEPVESEFVTLRQTNVREAPNTASRRVATIAEGKPVMVAGKVPGENWYLVEDQGKQLGYVFGELIEPASAAAQRRGEAERKAAEEKAQREAEADRQRVTALARQQQEEAARKAAAETARQEAERRAAEQQARQEAEAERQRLAALDRQRQQEEAARKAAEDKARRDAETERQRLATAERQRIQDEAARRAAEERTKQEAERKLKQDAERKAAEEKARRDAEAERQRLAAVERQRQQDEARRAAAERTRQESERRAAEESQRQQQQAAVAPPRPPTPASFNGHYRVALPAAAIPSLGRVTLELSITGTRVIAWASDASRGNVTCNGSGTLDSSGAIQNLQLPCTTVGNSILVPSIILGVRFAPDPTDGRMIGEGRYQTSEGQSGAIRWQRQGN